MEEVAEVFSRVEELYDEDKIFQAGRLLEGVISNGGESALERVRQHPRMSKIRQSCKDATDMMATMKKLDDWVICYNGKQTKVWYKAETGTKYKSLRSEAVLRADMISLLSIIYETDLHPDLFPFISESELLLQPARAKKIIRLSIQAPWPLKARETALFGYAVDGLDEDNCYFVYFREVVPEQDDCTPPAVPKDRVKMTVRRAAICFEPVSPTRTKVTTIANMDPAISFLTPAMLNWLSRAIFRLALRVFESKAQSIDRLPHASRLESGAIYVHLRERLHAFDQATWASHSRLCDEMDAARSNRSSVSIM
ncbi:hypothetical protein NDN08_005990 [Rhodosorus marinus]|uniref:START domain-containing protein n=1 Tax=Rhodosorus marinus TaxID=101924 RepID=A0AAV8UJE4_9RHOD|nr:hypothetical protein NDN08_005990 [Rhodosorus marinus]